MIEKGNKFREERSFGDRFSRDRVYMFHVYIYINKYIYIRDVSIHVRVGVDIYIMLTRT